MQERYRKTVTLVLGGVRSGKSRFAQKLGERASAVAFLATAKAADAEMEEKIRRHRQERPKDWETLEEPLELARVFVERARQFDMLLVDCLTVFVANLLADDPASAETRIEAFLAALKTASASVVLVSNEVGSGVVPAYPAGRRFRDLLGELNQKVAAVADNVVLMIAGLPVALKGQVEVGQIGVRP
jgi:adenosylcobinamide kinase / adenosylcobinamide-phosphate guanylyltransferase